MSNEVVCRTSLATPGLLIICKIDEEVLSKKQGPIWHNHGLFRHLQTAKKVTDSQLQEGCRLSIHTFGLLQWSLDLPRSDFLKIKLEYGQSFPRTQFQIECRTGGQSMAYFRFFICRGPNYFTGCPTFLYAPFMKLTKKHGKNGPKSFFLIFSPSSFFCFSLDLHCP